MDAPLIRPTFSLPLPIPRSDAIERIRAELVRRESLQGRWRGKGIWAELYVSEAQRRIWSPYLSIRVDEEDRGCMVFGRFGPHPEVWTFFMFLYFAIAFLVTFGATLGYVQWASDEPAWGLWAIWIGVPLLATIHVASALGHRWGQPQMRELRAILDDILQEIERADPATSPDP